MLKLGSFEGTIAPDMMITGLEKGDEPLVYAYRSPSCAFMAQETDPDWYELSFPGGSSVIALDQERDGSGTDMVPVKLMRRGVFMPSNCSERLNTLASSLLYIEVTSTALSFNFLT